MFSDDPDEDAASLDDEALLRAYLCPDETGAQPGQTTPADWPPRTRHEVVINIDAPVLAWFKANHIDWRREIRLVLKAWVAAQQAAARPRSDTRNRLDVAPAIEGDPIQRSDGPPGGG